MTRPGWRTSERILLLAVCVLAVLVVVRLANRDRPAPSASRPEAVVAPPSAGVARTRPIAGPPPSPACAEVLARIRSCSSKDLEGVVDGMGGLEAYRLYHRLSATDRQTVLSALPTPILARKAQELLGIPESSFRHLDEPGALASSLVDAAMGAATTDRQPQALVFATTVDDQGVPREQRGIFAPREHTVYACLDGGADASGDPGVLVRWSEVGSGSLVHLRYQPLSVNRRWNHVYFTVAEDWRPGSYRVAFYRIGATAALLAEGTYVVSGD